MIDSHGITIIRTNTDAAYFDMNSLINQIYTHIIESIKKQTKVSTKKSLIDHLSKKLLELEFKSNHSIKSMCLKWVVTKLQNITFYQITKNEKHTIRNKTDKNWKKTWNNVLFCM